MDFDSILHATLTPVALLSSVGLLLLSLVNRFNHAIDRLRELHRETNDDDDGGHAPLPKSSQIIYRRCLILRNAILCVACSMVCSAAIVCTTAIEGLLLVTLPGVKAMLLFSSVALMMVSSALFVVDITYSLKAVQLDLDLAPRQADSRFRWRLAGRQRLTTVPSPTGCELAPKHTAAAG